MIVYCGVGVLRFSFAACSDLQGSFFVACDSKRLQAGFRGRRVLFKCENVPCTAAQSVHDSGFNRRLGDQSKCEMLARLKQQRFADTSCRSPQASCIRQSSRIVALLGSTRPQGLGAALRVVALVRQPRRGQRRGSGSRTTLQVVSTRDATRGRARSRRGSLKAHSRQHPAAQQRWSPRSRATATLSRTPNIARNSGPGQRPPRSPNKWMPC